MKAMVFSDSQRKGILEALEGNEIHRALVHVWYALQADYPFFQEAERISRQGSRFHEKTKENILERILGKPETNSISMADPLALLCALDEYLNLRYGTQGPCPPAEISLGESRFFIHRRVTSRHLSCRHALQTGHLQSWLRYHWVIPSAVSGIQIRIVPSSRAHLNPDAFREKTSIRLFTADFPDGVYPEWQERKPPVWTAEKLTNTETRWKSVVGRLREAMKEGCEIVVFPELTICPELRARVSSWLVTNPEHPFRMILPGSFHQQMAGGRFNYAELFSRTGKPMLSHHKLATFGDKKKPEGIQTGNTVKLLDTPIGLIGMPICLDFCEEGSPFSVLWEAIGPEFLLVPAFGTATSIGAHRRRADTLLRSHGTVTALANQNPEGDDKDHGFICHEAGAHGADGDRALIASIKLYPDDCKLK